MFIKRGWLRPLSLVIGFAMPLSAFSSTSGIPSPNVREGDSSAQYRTNYRPAQGTRRASFDHRLHYQQSLNDRVRLRAILQYSGIAGQQAELAWTRLESQWQYYKRPSGGGAAVRFDLQKYDSNTRADFARLVWIGDRKFGALSTRANLLFGKEFGHNARSGFTVGSRIEVSLRSEGGTKYGVQYLNTINTTADYGDFESQNHQLGPIVERSFGQWSVFASYLHGVSDSAPEGAIRFFLNRKFN
ncbi:MAG: hypothetical protein ACI9B8_003803 [Sulfitobacter sp.]